MYMYIHMYTCVCIYIYIHYLCNNSHARPPLAGSGARGRRGGLRPDPTTPLSPASLDVSPAAFAGSRRAGRAATCAAMGPARSARAAGLILTRRRHEVRDAAGRRRGALTPLCRVLRAHRRCHRRPLLWRHRHHRQATGLRNLRCCTPCTHHADPQPPVV